MSGKPVFSDEAQGDKQKEAIRAKCKTYIERAEKLKDYEKKKKPKPVKADGDTTDKNNKNSSDEDEADPEKKKLQDRLQGTF